MSQNIKDSRGFTLVELLVAVAIIGIISVISVQSLYDAVSIRSKQYFIEGTSDDVRSLVRLVTKSVMEGEEISVPNPHEIGISKHDGGMELCQTILFDTLSGEVKQSQITGVSCDPPNTGFVVVTGNNIKIEDLSFFASSGSYRTITLKIVYKYLNALGNHPFVYQTTITPRV